MEFHEDPLTASCYCHASDDGAAECRSKMWSYWAWLTVLLLAASAAASEADQTVGEKIFRKIGEELCMVVAWSCELVCPYGDHLYVENIKINPLTTTGPNYSPHAKC